MLKINTCNSDEYFKYLINTKITKYLDYKHWVLEFR